ncbi:MAG TPA: LamG-like jellyroll fold domain-containing protein [Myxococcaceae bacterium]|nr:LamG-like jellyroll fold domain-containing protein [Myxococcaceae bacterium]
MLQVRRLWVAACIALVGFSGSAWAQIPTSGLNLWLRSDGSFSVSGGRVASWLDDSGTGRHASQMVSTSQPRLISPALNGYPVVRFDGAQMIATATPLYLSRWTIFVVGKYNNPNETFGLILGPGDNGNNQLRYENGSQLLLYGGSNGMPVITSSIGNTRVYHALAVRYDGGSLNVFRDGVLKSSHGFSTSGSWVLGRIGSWFSSCSSCFLQGDLAEIIVYDRALSESERTSVNSYLRAKYALP